MPKKTFNFEIPTQDLRSYLAIEGDNNRKLFLNSLNRKSGMLNAFLDLQGEGREKATEAVMRENVSLAEAKATAHWAICTFGQTPEDRDANRFRNLRIYQRELEILAPPDHCRFEEGEKGSWILIKEMPGLQENLSPLSLWWAQPWPCKHIPTRVKVITPAGEIGVLPPEYSKVSDLGPYLDALRKDYDLVFFGDAKSVLPYDRLHYLMSRGIEQATAYEMLLGDLKAPGVCWFEPRDHVLAYFGFERDPQRFYVRPYNIEESVRLKMEKDNAPPPPKEPKPPKKNARRPAFQLNLADWLEPSRPLKRR